MMVATSEEIAGHMRIWMMADITRKENENWKANDLEYLKPVDIRKTVSSVCDNLDESNLMKAIINIIN